MKTIKNIIFVTIPTLIILFFVGEILSSFFFPGTYPPCIIWDEQYNIGKWDPKIKKTGIYTIGNFSQQRAKWVINNEGWNNPKDYFSLKKNGLTRIAVIGDSYIESFQVDIDNSFPVLLDKNLPDNFEVYSFGASGAALSQYLHYSRYIHEKYDPDIYIFNIVHNDFSGSLFGIGHKSKKTFKIIEDKIVEIEPIPYKRVYKKMPLSSILRKSSLIRYLYGNLKINEIFKKKDLKSKDSLTVNANIYVENVSILQTEIEKVVDYFLYRLTIELKGKKIFLIIDASRFDIYDEISFEDSDVKFLHDIILKHSLKYNITLLDLTKPMTNEYKINNKKFNSKYDGHWDEYGHYFVYKKVYNIIMNIKE